MFNFLFKNKIEGIENEGYRLYLEAVKSAESDSVKVSVNLLDEENFEKLEEHLKEVEGAMEVLEEIEQKYLRLKERYKHDNKILLETVIDWRDINVLHRDLLAHKLINNENIYKIKTDEILKRFDKLLKN